MGLHVAVRGLEPQQAAFAKTRDGSSGSLNSCSALARQRINARQKALGQPYVPADRNPEPSLPAAWGPRVDVDELGQGRLNSACQDRLWTAHAAAPDARSVSSLEESSFVSVSQQLLAD